MRRTLAAIIATGAILLSGMAHAEVLHRGKVHQVTADKLITERRMTCVYGQWQSQPAPNGATILTRTKVCQ